MTEQMPEATPPPAPAEPIPGPEDILHEDVSQPIPEVDEPIQTVVQQAAMMLPDVPEELLNPPEFFGPDDIK